MGFMDQLMSQIGQVGTPINPGVLGTFNRPPPMRAAPQAPGRPPPMAAPPPPMRRPPPMRAAPPSSIMGMYGGGMGSGPLGRSFMTSNNKGRSWQAAPQQSPNQNGWTQTSADPDGAQWRMG